MGMAVENHNVDITETITHLSLCSGYDGIGLGLRRVWPKVREIAHVEIEAFAAANLVAKMEAGELDSAPVWTNLKTFPAWRFRGCVDILSAGFPCQPFSCAGARAADDDPRHLWPHVRQAVGLIRPGMVVFENVEGIISSKLKGGGWNDPEGTPVLLHVLRELERTGYKCTWGVFSAAEVGASHQRKRVFIVGMDDTRGSKLGWLSDFWGKENTATRKPGKELADSKSRREKRKSREFREKKEKPKGENAGDEFIFNSKETLWPACPGEEQYEWEEPRVVANSASRRSRKSGDEHQERERCKSNRGSSKGCDTNTKTQSRLGGATNGTTSRVDRLRLLGNGVVPQTAEKAVRTLLSKLTDTISA